jgi:hypothetical protein
MLNLRLWHFKDVGKSWIIQCKQCAAGWIPEKGDYDPGAFIAHSLKHQRRPTRIEEVQSHIAAVARAIAAIDLELGIVAATTLLQEREHFMVWDRVLSQELHELLREQAEADALAAAAPPRVFMPPVEQHWLPNRSYITHRAWRL